MLREETKKDLKELISPIIFLTGVFALVILLITINTTLNRKKKVPSDFVYVSKIILQDTHPVINVEENATIGLPYTDKEVKQSRGFYDYNKSDEEQENSLIFYDDTYIQNSGIDYSKKDVFDVVSILDGTVTSIKEDKLLGKIVELKHSNELISVYQSMGEITVKEGQEVTKGEVLGKTGTSNISSDLDNHLHFELYYKGQVVNPNDYYNKKLEDL